MVKDSVILSNEINKYLQQGPPLASLRSLSPPLPPLPPPPLPPQGLPPSASSECAAASFAVAARPALVYSPFAVLTFAVAARPDLLHRHSATFDARGFRWHAARSASRALISHRFVFVAAQCSAPLGAAAG